MSQKTQSELDHERLRLQQAIDKGFDVLLEKERYVPSLRVEARELRASEIPAFELHHMTGYEIEMGDITFRLIRRSTRLRRRIGGWLIEKVGDPARGLYVDKFRTALRLLLWDFQLVMWCRLKWSGQVRITFNVWQRRPG